MNDICPVGLGRGQLNDSANEVCTGILKDREFMMNSKMQEDQLELQYLLS